MKYIYIVFFLLFYSILFSQSTDQNYNVTKVYKIATQRTIEDPTPNEANISVIYSDGFE